MSAWDELRRPVWLFDPVSCRGVYANLAALALWGASDLEELLSRDFSKLSPAVRTRTERLQAVTADGREVEERWTFYPNGQPVTVQAVISTVALHDGREVLLFEAAAAEVEAEERRAVEALRHSSGPVGLFDGAGASLFANPAAFAAYGLDAGFEARFAIAGEGEGVLARAMDGQATGALFQMRTRSGPRWHHIDCRPLHDPVTGAISVLLNERDVTDRIEAETARAAAEQKAAMAEARQRFLTDMSHELRTPLNAVLGFSALLADAGLEPVQHGHASRIHVAGERLAEVVEQMIGRSSQGAEPVRT
ncbi:MAG: diguanylate cyclase, partial [Brevundimonas sp.]